MKNENSRRDVLKSLGVAGATLSGIKTIGTGDAVASSGYVTPEWWAPKTSTSEQYSGNPGKYELSTDLYYKGKEGEDTVFHQFVFTMTGACTLHSDDGAEYNNIGGHFLKMDDSGDGVIRPPAGTENRGMGPAEDGTRPEEGTLWEDLITGTISNLPVARGSVGWLLAASEVMDHFIADPGAKESGEYWQYLSQTNASQWTSGDRTSMVDGIIDFALEQPKDAPDYSVELVSGIGEIGGSRSDLYYQATTGPGSYYQGHRGTSTKYTINLDPENGATIEDTGSMKAYGPETVASYYDNNDNYRIEQDELDEATEDRNDGQIHYLEWQSVEEAKEKSDELN